MKTDLLVRIGKVSYKAKLLEIMYDYSKDSGVLEEDRIRSQDLIRKSNNEKN